MFSTVRIAPSILSANFMDMERDIRMLEEAGADIIMLDNMTTDQMRAAIDLIDGRVETECSGNVTKENIERLISLGVD